MNTIPSHFWLGVRRLLDMRFAIRVVSAILIMNLCLGLAANSVYGQNDCYLFKETNISVCGTLLRYWEQNGGLRQQGFPISTEIQEQSDTDGKVYTVQYFERAVFELHPENQPPYDVLLSHLGRFEYKRRYSDVAPAKEIASTDNPLVFEQTHKTVGGRFRAYWEQNGGLRQQGYPISNEFQERSRLDGKVYTVQYFERAVFELHPENQPPYDVLLSQLGTFRYQYRNYKQLPQDCRSAYTRAGTVLGQGTNTIPTRIRKLKSYRLEEVTWPGPITCKAFLPDPSSREGQIREQTLTFDKVWRLTITAEQVFYPGEAGWYLWLDDALLGIGVPDASATELTTIVYDRTLLREGATIGVAYGRNYQPEEVLPEKLVFGSLH